MTFYSFVANVPFAWPLGRAMMQDHEEATIFGQRVLHHGTCSGQAKWKVARYCKEECKTGLNTLTVHRHLVCLICL